MIEEICPINRGIPKIISLVFPFCLICSLTWSDAWGQKGRKRRSFRKSSRLLKAQWDDFVEIPIRILIPTFSHRLTLWGSEIFDFSIKGLIGLKESKPFAADQGKPLFFTLSCMLRAVMSIARARKKKRSDKMKRETRPKSESRRRLRRLEDGLTITSDVRVCFSLRDVSSILAHYHS